MHHASKSHEEVTQIRVTDVDIKQCNGSNRSLKRP